MNSPSPLGVAAKMFSQDSASQMLGMVLEEVTLGTARLSMTVRPDMVNGLNVCHGGLIFTLADSAFAFACNSHNHNTVAAGCSIEFIAPGKLGDTLVAQATEILIRGRQGVYDVSVTCRQRNEIIAIFRGKSARIGGQVIATPSPD